MDPHQEKEGAATPVPGVPPSVTENGDELDEFIYLISHDVRASVRALLELPQWIVEDLEDAGVTLNGTVAESIDLMNRHSRRLDRMMVDLLTHSRVGRMQDVKRVELAPAVAKVVSALPLPERFEIATALDCEEITMGERDILTLFAALLDNGIKHHDRAEGRISVSSRRAGGDVVIEVRDDGPGIPVQFRSRVFGAMITLKPRDDVEGSGMGLAHVAKIAEHYGGRAKVAESNGRRGTSVEVRFPDPSVRA